jgi:hypothetical protein
MDSAKPRSQSHQRAIKFISQSHHRRAQSHQRTRCGSLAAPSCSIATFMASRQDHRPLQIRFTVSPEGHYTVYHTPCGLRGAKATVPFPRIGPAGQDLTRTPVAGFAWVVRMDNLAHRRRYKTTSRKINDAGTGRARGNDAPFGNAIANYYARPHYHNRRQSSPVESISTLPASSQTANAL